MELEELFSEFWVLHDFTEVKGISPKECHLNSISKKLSTLRAEAKDYLVAEGLAVPKPPLWGKDNDPTEWWNVNDFEILSTCYQHEVEMFLKIVAPYFPKVQELDNYSFPELRTPTGKSAPPSSVTELPPPRKFRSAQGEPHNRFRLPPLSTITSGRNLTRLISDKPVTPSEKEVNSDYPPRAPWNNWHDSENPFSKETDPKEVNDKQDKIPRRMERLIPPGGPPSDGSGSDGESEPNRPPKIPPRSDKRPLTKSNSAEPAVKSYHFNLKLKPETVPQWDGNADTLARWLNKINHLADGSTHVHRELGKIVPQRFTSSAETWYYSIPDYECVKAKVNWSCLRNIISGYWMNHHWLEKQKSEPIKLDLEKPVTSMKVQVSMLSGSLNLSDWYIIIPTRKPSKLSWKKFLIPGLLSWILST